MSLNSLELTPDDIKANKKQVPSVPANIESRVKQVCVCVFVCVCVGDCDVWSHALMHM